MALSDSIARLQTLAAKIANAVTLESTQAAELIASKDAALAESANAIVALKAEVEALKASVGNVDTTALEAAIVSVETATDTIADVIADVNISPLADLVVDSVQSDSAPTPGVVEETEVLLESVTPVEVANVATSVIDEAVTEVVEALP